MPRLKDKMAIAPKRARKKIYAMDLESGMLKETRRIFKWTPLYNNSPASIMKDVNIGPMTITGILIKEYIIPHKRQVIKA